MDGQTKGQKVENASSNGIPCGTLNHKANFYEWSQPLWEWNLPVETNVFTHLIIFPFASLSIPAIWNSVYRNG